MNWEQLKTILWLRWRLTRNQWARGGGVGGALAVIVGFGAFVVGTASFAGGLIGAMQGLREAAPLNVMVVWLVVTSAFLFLWLIGLLAALQRSETIDLQRLMHLPVALGQMFFLNYLTSHLALSIILMVPGMIGLAIGLVITRGPMMLLLLPLALSMVFMITAWTYCLRGWLAAMMTNPRRRRTIIMGITLAFVLLSQGPNLYFNVIRRHASLSPRTAATPEEVQRRREARSAAEREMRERLFTAQKFIPPLWVPEGARALAEGRVLPALLGTLGCFIIGAFGLRRAYRSTVRFYHGETGSKVVAQVESAQTSSAAAGAAKAGVWFLELHLPAVPEQAAALALATFRSLLRAPEVKMAWASSFIVTVVIGSSLFLRSAAKVPEVAKPFVAGGSMAFAIFMLVQFLANQFGFDRDGFRALILSPAERRLILLGKNLASLIVGATFGTLLLAITSFWLRLPLLSVVAGLFQLAALLLLAGLVGNMLSILVPYRIQSGSMKPTKMPALATLVMVLCHLLFPIAMAPVFLPPLLELLWQMAGWPQAVPVNLVCSVALSALMVYVYWWSLEPLGRLLQRRETKILSVVTVEVE